MTLIWFMDHITDYYKIKIWQCIVIPINDRVDQFIINCGTCYYILAIGVITNMITFFIYISAWIFNVSTIVTEEELNIKDHRKTELPCKTLTDHTIIWSCLQLASQPTNQPTNLQIDLGRKFFWEGYGKANNSLNSLVFVWKSDVKYFSNNLTWILKKL